MITSKPLDKTTTIRLAIAEFCGLKPRRGLLVPNGDVMGLDYLEWYDGDNEFASPIPMYSIDGDALRNVISKLTDAQYELFTVHLMGITGGNGSNVKFRYTQEADTAQRAEALYKTIIEISAK